MKKYPSILLAFCALMMFGIASNANALTIDLSTPTLTFGEQTAMPQIEAIVFPLMGTATQLYRATPPSTEGYSLAGSYTTVFAGDNETAVISYDGSNFVGGTAFLLAKDGKANDDLDYTHAWYFYNLTELGWDGRETIELGVLWPKQGSFSHVSLYGTSTPPPTHQTPEPGIFVLLGLGLPGIAGVRKKNIHNCKTLNFRKGRVH